VTGDGDGEGAGDTFSSSTVIALVSAAALVFALVAGALLWCLCRRKRQQRTPSTAAAAAGDNTEGAAGNAGALAQPRDAESAGETGGGSTSGDGGGSDSAHPTQDIAAARATSSAGPLRPSPPPESGDSENRPGGEDPTPHRQQLEDAAPCDGGVDSRAPVPSVSPPSAAEKSRNTVPPRVLAEQDGAGVDASKLQLARGGYEGRDRG
ncbi:unnamed protein product, partial [Ectocarpus sp. 8 AP-2014]